MDYTIVELPEGVIIGPTIRTANDAIDCEQVIGNLWQRFMNDGMEASVPLPILDPYACFALYYEYDASNNAYTMMIGAESGAPEAPAGMERTTIPAGRYAKFDIRGSDCKDSVIAAWNEIWSDDELAARRAYTIDFEAYLPNDDTTCADIDLYVALKD